MRKSRLNISSIADELNVSVSTVSRAINGKKGVSEKKRQEILALAREMGIPVDIPVQTIHNNGQKMVAILLGDIRNPFYSELVGHMQTKLLSKGYLTMIFNSGYDVDRELDFLQLIQNSGFSGLIMVTAQDSKVADIINNQMELPMVLVNRTLDSYKGSSVLTDNYQAGYMAALHLIDCGHKHIGFIKGPEKSSASSQRFEGFLQALNNYNLQLDEDYIYASDLTLENGSRIARQFNENPAPRPTAMAIVNDWTALGFIDVCEKNHIDVPKDLSVISFDDIWCAGLGNIELTTVSQHCSEMGDQAVNLLLEQIDGTLTAPQRNIIVPTLMIRKTTERV